MEELHLVRQRREEQEQYGYPGQELGLEVTTPKMHANVTDEP